MFLFGVLKYVCIFTVLKETKTTKKNDMKNLNKIIKEYSKEDLQILIENGVLAITNTAYKFPIWFDFDGKNFKASKNDGTILIETNRKALIRSFIEGTYITA